MTELRQSTYLLDTNILIQAHRTYYSFDLCPGFWDCLIHHCGANRLLSIDRVRQEITKGDQLHEWAQAAPESFFVSTDDLQVIQTYARIMESVQASADYPDAAKADFARGADGWLVAYAYVNGHTVVTHETFEPQSKKSVKIPNVCREFDVAYSDPFVMLRELEVQFRWAA